VLEGNGKEERRWVLAPFDARQWQSGKWRREGWEGGVEDSSWNGEGEGEAECELAGNTRGY